MACCFDVKKKQRRSSPATPSSYSHSVAGVGSLPPRFLSLLLILPFPTPIFLLPSHHHHSSKTLETPPRLLSTFATLPLLHPALPARTCVKSRWVNVGASDPVLVLVKFSGKAICSNPNPPSHFYCSVRKSVPGPAPSLLCVLS